MRHFTASFLYVVGVIVLTGCAGKGETIPLEFKAIPSARSLVTQPADRLKVVVETFQDVRPDVEHVGVRTHLWGGVTYFRAGNATIADAFTRLMAEYVKQRGWEVKVRQERGSVAAKEADITISGDIRELWVRAKSRFGSTVLSFKANAVVRVANASDGSKVTLGLDGVRNGTVMRFDQDDVQEILNLGIRDSLQRMTADIMVVDKAVRLQNSGQR
ncbi:MAG: hypothetical protein ACE5NA_10220 [Nitrospiraceae bacterium]